MTKPTPRSSEFIGRLQDPVNAALRGDRENMAEELQEVLASLSGFDQESIKGILYSAPRANGRWEFIQDLAPPYDLTDIMNMCKEEFGGGDYVFRLMVDGKIKKTFFFSIKREKNEALNGRIAGRGDDQVNMFQLMMAQQAEARQDAQAANDRMMQMMLQSNQQTMQMFAAMSQQSSTMMTAMLGGREKVTDFLPMIAAMNKGQGGGIKETLDALVIAKGLFQGDGGEKDDAPGFDADNVVGSLVRMAGPVASAISRAVGRGGGQAQPNPAALDYTGADPEPVAPLTFPGPAPTAAIAPPIVPRDTIDAAGYGRFPVLAAVRDEVVLMFSKGYSPRTAAAAIYDRVVELGVTEDQLGELVVAFTSSPDVLGELAAAGIDLRARPDWAGEFFQELVACHAEAGDDDDDGDAEPDTLGGDQHPAGPRRRAANA